MLYIRSVENSRIDIDFDNSLGPWLGRTMKMVEYRLQTEFGRAGLDITKEQMIVLKKLYEHDGLNQNELAELTYRDKSSLTRLLGTMERKDYIRKERCPEDKRVNYVYLTDAGTAMWHKTKPVAQLVVQQMQADLKPEEIEQLRAILKKIQGSLKHSALAQLF